MLIVCLQCQLQAHLDWWVPLALPIRRLDFKVTLTASKAAELPVNAPIAVMVILNSN